MNYDSFNELDFAMDDLFIRWVRFPDEASNRFWQQWLQEHPGKREQVESARRLVLSIRMKEAAWKQEDEQVLKEKIMAAIEGQQAAPPITGRPARVVRFKKQYWWAAAVAIGVLIGAAVLWKTVATKELRYKTLYGQIKEFQLPDGSVVTLHANSNMAYQLNEERHIRELSLHGEGFFKIKKDTTHPFIVYANGLAVKVVGTEFNVRSRSATTMVALKSGKVQLMPAEAISTGQADTAVNLEPGQSVEYSRTSKHFTQTKSANVKEYTRWKEGKLVFDKTPLALVAEQVRYVYGIQLQFPKHMQSLTFSATIPVQDMETDITVLEALLSESFQLETDKKEDIIYFRDTKH